ncbi:MAG: fasciclin domain-containing protein [Pirellulaceae bacterium]
MAPRDRWEVSAPDKSKLIGILTYHVVAVRVTADDVQNLTAAINVATKTVKIAVKDGKVMIDHATVISTDIPCTNGVNHVVDSVILPS